MYAYGEDDDDIPEILLHFHEEKNKNSDNKSNSNKRTRYNEQIEDYAPYVPWEDDEGKNANGKKKRGGGGDACRPAVSTGTCPLVFASAEQAMRQLRAYAASHQFGLRVRTSRILKKSADTVVVLECTTAKECPFRLTLRHSGKRHSFLNLEKCIFNHVHPNLAAAADDDNASTMIVTEVDYAHFLQCTLDHQSGEGKRRAWMRTSGSDSGEVPRGMMNESICMHPAIDLAVRTHKYQTEGSNAYKSAFNWKPAVSVAGMLEVPMCAVEYCGLAIFCDSLQETDQPYFKWWWNSVLLTGKGDPVLLRVKNMDALSLHHTLRYFQLNYSVLGGPGSGDGSTEHAIFSVPDDDDCYLAIGAESLRSLRIVSLRHIDAAVALPHAPILTQAWALTWEERKPVVIVDEAKRKLDAKAADDAKFKTPFIPGTTTPSVPIPMCVAKNGGGDDDSDECADDDDDDDEDTAPSQDCNGIWYPEGGLDYSRNYGIAATLQFILHHIHRDTCGTRSPSRCTCILRIEDPHFQIYEHLPALLSMYHISDSYFLDSIRRAQPGGSEFTHIDSLNHIVSGFIFQNAPHYLHRTVLDSLWGRFFHGSDWRLVQKRHPVAWAVLQHMRAKGIAATCEWVPVRIPGWAHLGPELASVEPVSNAQYPHYYLYQLCFDEQYISLDLRMRLGLKLVTKVPKHVKESANAPNGIRTLFAATANSRPERLLFSQLRHYEMALIKSVPRIALRADCKSHPRRLVPFTRESRHLWLLNILFAFLREIQQLAWTPHLQSDGGVLRVADPAVFAMCHTDVPVAIDYGVYQPIELDPATISTSNTCTPSSPGLFYFEQSLLVWKGTLVRPLQVHALEAYSLVRNAKFYAQGK